MSTPTPRYEESIKFLRRFHPNGRRWVLTGINPDRTAKPATVTATFDEGRIDACREWLEDKGRIYNLYFSVGEINKDLSSKADRIDIARVVYLHVDLDPRAGEDIASEQQRILKLLQHNDKLPEPTAITFSGGGYQGFWALENPISIDGDLNKAEDAKLYNLFIEHTLGADHCHNVDRIMRLVGSVNRPDEKKRAKGRTEALAEVIDFQDVKYGLDRFPKAVASKPADSTAPKSVPPSNVVRLKSIEDLPDTVSKKLKIVICQGIDPDEPNKFPSRSEWLFYVVCGLMRAGISDDVNFSIITDPQFGISSSVLEQDNKARRYALRQIERALALGCKPLPQIFLPSPTRTNREVALELSPLCRAAGWKRRGRTIVTCENDGYLEPIKGARAITALEKVAKFMRYSRPTKDHPSAPEPCLLDKDAVPPLIASDEILSYLPRISVVSRCPVLIERQGTLVEVSDFDEPSGIYIVPDAPEPISVPFEEAKVKLLALLGDWKFSTDSDKARAFVFLVNPALNESGMLGIGRFPIDVIQADHSQAGKGFLVRMRDAIYRDKSAYVTCKAGGVGSPGETFASQMIEGHRFICFDNWRGPFNLPSVEAAMTQDSIDCRAPGKGSMNVDSRKTILSMTSNGAELTVDMANRANIILILKQPSAFEFYRWQEGVLLEHVLANQPYYLGSIWSILREWHRQGRPIAADNKQHDFRPWACAVRYISQNVMGLADPLADYHAVQHALSDPALIWARLVMLAVMDAKRLSHPLKAGDLLDIIRERPEIEIPGVLERDRDSEHTQDTALRGIGRRFGTVFNGAEEEEGSAEHQKISSVIVDGVTITRFETLSEKGQGRTDKVYVFGQRQIQTVLNYTEFQPPA